MNHCGIQQQQKKKSNFSSSFGNSGEPVVCPKPRRFNLLNHDPVIGSPLRWPICYQQEPYESKPGPELLDLMLPGALDQSHTQLAASPPFFCGSPPSRVSNPLIQDARFGDERISPISPRSMIPNPSSGVASSSNGGYIRAGYGNKPSVRIEGFNCLDRDNRRNCSIPAHA